MPMDSYTAETREELKKWQKAMKRKPSFLNRTTRNVQQRINRAIPEKVHKVFTTAIKQMTRAVVFGAGITNPKPLKGKSLEVVETGVRERIKFYRSTAAAEGAVTGAGGILLGLADFPLWLSLKMKMLFEIASRYGFDTRDYKERVYLLHIFQLTFSSQEKRNEVYKTIANWDRISKDLPEDIHQFDWRSFQLEYRDYIDIAKLLQLIPGFGAAVGTLVNYRLTDKLGKTAMNAYRMRSKI